MPITITFEAITPGRNFLDKKAAKLQAVLVAALQGPVALTLVGALRKRSASWSDSPRWSAKVSAGGRLILTLMPTGAGEKKWRWVSGGTRPHPIDPKRRRVLKFGTDYIPKTLPKVAYGGAGAYTGGEAFAHHVDHPGIAARAFEEDVVDEKGDDVIGILAAAVASI